MIFLESVRQPLAASSMHSHHSSTTPFYVFSILAMSLELLPCPLKLRPNRSPCQQQQQPANPDSGSDDASAFFANWSQESIAVAQPEALSPTLQRHNGVTQ